MATLVTFGFDIDVARGIWNNNEQLRKEGNKFWFRLHTTETWLPAVLSQAGFFTSNGEVKKNQPKFWRDLVDGETVELSWARIIVSQVSGIIEVDTSVLV